MGAVHAELCCVGVFPFACAAILHTSRMLKSRTVDQDFTTSKMLPRTLVVLITSFVSHKLVALHHDLLRCRVFHGRHLQTECI